MSICRLGTFKGEAVLLWASLSLHKLKNIANIGITYPASLEITLFPNTKKYARIKLEPFLYLQSLIFPLKMVDRFRYNNVRTNRDLI